MLYLESQKNTVKLNAYVRIALTHRVKNRQAPFTEVTLSKRFNGFGIKMEVVMEIGI